MHLMSEHEAIVRYDGPALAGHKMDIEDVAPALMALADLCKRVNTIANGERASVQLFIDMDVEQHCAQFKLQIVQTLYDAATSLLGDDRVTTAQTIFKALGLAASPFVGLFKLLKMLKGRKVDSTKLIVKDGQNCVQLNAGGDIYFVHPLAADLIRDPQMLRKAKTVVFPATKDGYEKIEFEEDGKVAEEIGREDALLIQSVPPQSVDANAEITIPESHIRAQVKIKRAVYIGNGKWTIQYDKSREMAITHEEWVADFQAHKVDAPPTSFLDVDITVSAIKLDKSGEPIEEPTYTITHVYGVVPAPETGDMFNKN